MFSVIYLILAVASKVSVFGRLCFYNVCYRIATV